MDLNVAATLRIMPTDVNVDLEEIKGKLSGIIDKFGDLHSTDIKPIAFGLKSLDIVVLLNDGKGGIDEIETGLRQIDGVGDVNVLDVNRL